MAENKGAYRFRQGKDNKTCKAVGSDGHCKNA